MSENNCSDDFLPPTPKTESEEETMENDETNAVEHDSEEHVDASQDNADEKERDSEIKEEGVQDGDGEDSEVKDESASSADANCDENEAEDSESQTSSDDEPLCKAAKKVIAGPAVEKGHKNDLSENDKSSSDTGDDEEKTAGRPKHKKQQQKTKSFANTVKAASPRLTRLKKYLSVAGIRVQCYEKVFHECKSMKSKERKLLSLLEDHGLAGKPTLQKCKELKEKKEDENEVADLNIGNILPQSGKRRRTRSGHTETRQQYNKNNSDDQKPVVDKSWQNNLADLVDSDDEKTVEEHPRSKRKAMIYESDE